MPGFSAGMEWRPQLAIRVWEGTDAAGAAAIGRSTLKPADNEIQPSPGAEGTESDGPGAPNGGVVSPTQHTPPPAPCVRGQGRRVRGLSSAG